MRKQYHFRPSPRGILAWDVDRLVELSRDFERRRLPLGQIRELDDVWYGQDEKPTWRAMVEHIKLIDDADLSFPIILSANGSVMDGMHRAAKALRHGQEDIEAVRFDHDPAPDHVGLGPEDVPY